MSRVKRNWQNSKVSIIRFLFVKLNNFAIGAEDLEEEEETLNEEEDQSITQELDTQIV